MCTVLSRAAASIFLPLYLKAICLHFCLQVPVPCIVGSSSSSVALQCPHCGTCLAMLSSFLLTMYPNLFHFLLHSFSSTASWSIFHHCSSSSVHISLTVIIDQPWQSVISHKTIYIFYFFIFILLTTITVNVIFHFFTVVLWFNDTSTLMWLP